MNRLFAVSEAAKELVSLDYVRPLYNTILWENQMNALLGTRGVGKTTLMIQRLLRLNLPPSKALYIELGDIYFQTNRLFDFVQAYVAQGGQYLFIDEVHRYGSDTWAQELKQTYDLYRHKLLVTFTGSSAIRILRQKADLSRRVLQHRVPGLSFREYVYLKSGLEIPVIAYKDLLENHLEVASKLMREKDFLPLALLADYNREGYYPVFLDGAGGYLKKLNTIIQLVLESDIPAVMESGKADYRQLGSLLYSIASAVPFKPNITKLATRLSMSRNTLLKYLVLLERADLIKSLRTEAKGIAALAKPDKIFLDNTNLLYALAPNQWATGTMRETFFLNQLSFLEYEAHILPPEIRLPKQGDFVLLDKFDRYVFEVGGPKKSSKQIGNETNRFVVTDSEITGSAHRIPLWLFGLLY